MTEKVKGRRGSAGSRPKRPSTRKSQRGEGERGTSRGSRGATDSTRGARGPRRDGPRSESMRSDRTGDRKTGSARSSTDRQRPQRGEERRPRQRRDDVRTTGDERGRNARFDRTRTDSARSERDQLDSSPAENPRLLKSRTEAARAERFRAEKQKEAEARSERPRSFKRSGGRDAGRRARAQNPRVKEVRGSEALVKRFTTRTRTDEVRLQKFLAECGVGSRRKMEELIVEGRVQVNGKVVNTLGSKVNPFTDRIEVNRKLVKPAHKGIMLLNKPRGVVSTLSDPEGRPTVADFLTKHCQSYFPVGRLDWDSTGLMIMTNDGELAELLMHPRYQFDRVYHARVEGAVNESLLSRIEKGVKLRDGIARGVARLVGNNEATTWIEIRVREGRNRLVRRMFEELGHPVVKLKRVEYGPFKLGKLDVGQVRHLTEKEYAQVRKKMFGELLAPKAELTSDALEKERAEKKKLKKRGRTRLE